MIDTDTETKLTDALRKTIPYLREESSAYADDGDNEPLELVREIESLLIDHNDAIEDAYEAENNPDTARAQPASVAGRLVWTPAMLEAGRAASMEAEAVYDNDRPKGTWERFGLRDNRVRHIVNAVIAAAPQPPAKESDR